MNSDDDIVTRLRRVPEKVPKGGMTVGPNIFYQRCQDAANEIERLRNGIEKYVTTVSDSYCTNAMERDALELLKETWRG